jgi:hypothetical protein
MAHFFMDLQLKVGIGRSNGMQDTGEKEWRDRWDQTEAHRSGRRRSIPVTNEGKIPGPEKQIIGAPDDREADRGEYDVPSVPLDQAHPKHGLQLLQAGRKRRLGYVAGLGRPSEVLVLMKRDQVLKLFE